MTLPTISPVILFAVVLGVIQGLQYFTQAYVAASIASGQASQAGDTFSGLGYPNDSTLFYPVLLYQHGFNDFQMGYASAMAMLLLDRLVRGDARDRAQLAQVGAPGGAAVTAPAAPATIVRRRPPAAVRRKRFLLAVARHSVLIAVAIAFLAPFVFIVLTSLMTTNQALSSHLWPHPFRFRELRRRVHEGAALALDVQHDGVLRPRDDRAARLVDPGRLRARAAALARPRGRRSSSCWSR